MSAAPTAGPEEDRARNARPDGTRTTHFGFEEVRLGEKQGRVDEVFHSVAARYDLMNDLMSAGLHRLWKDALVNQLRPPWSRAFRHLDVAGGTGDVAFRIARAGGPETQVEVVDINTSMLEVGRERAEKAGLSGQVSFRAGNAEALPLPERSRDALTIAFGIRNVPRMELALAEAWRVLRRGGRFLCLEFAPVDTPGLDRLYDAFSFKVIPPLGRLVTGEAEPYQYLVESIRRFPRPEAFAGMIGEAGFAQVSYRPLTGGIVNIHSGWKL